jgi:LAS superfamily LD-carboxypeptidase LdcB
VGKLWALRILTGALLAGALLAAVVGLSSRARRDRELEEEGRQAAGLLAQAQDLLARHPDFPFPEAERSLAAYGDLSPREMGKDLAAIRSFYAELEQSAVSRATGRQPGASIRPELLQYKTFSPNGFRDLYEAQAEAQASQTPAVPPEVTGQAAADERIARRARARGYRLRAQADPTRLADAGGGRLLAPQALEAFRGLQAEAAAQGQRLELVSGFRSVARQKAIFLGALAEQCRRRLGRSFAAREIAEGAADAALEAALAESAPPGFSRHHTGFALDLNDPSSGRPFTEFGDSRAYRWLAADNFLAAKRFGFIPSYPPGAGAQGPDPEPWEFVWVGEAALAAAH